MTANMYMMNGYIYLHDLRGLGGVWQGTCTKLQHILYAISAKVQLNMLTIS